VKAVLFAGGKAGEIALEKLVQEQADFLAGVVWDHNTGPLPATESVTFLTEANCRGKGEVLLCSGYGRVIDQSMIDAFPRGAFNAHPSLLPAYRGRHAIQWALAGGEKEMGVTVHRMTAQLDCGDYVLVRRRRFGITVKLAEAAEALADMAAEMLVELASMLKTNSLPKPLPNPEARGRYWRRRQPEDGRIDWGAAAMATINKVRAAQRDYPAYAYLADGSKVNFDDFLAGDTPGEVLWSSPYGCLIAAADGVVWLVPDRPLKKGDILT
jgi:methionyl-tRNA formyltransferase